MEEKHEKADYASGDVSNTGENSVTAEETIAVDQSESERNAEPVDETQEEEKADTEDEQSTGEGDEEVNQVNQLETINQKRQEEKQIFQVCLII